LPIAPIPSAPLTGERLCEMFQSASTWMDRHVDAINALNVFPVPDGDTGLNMSLTLQSAVAALPVGATPTVAEMADALAHGALMGARGNSGVILAQYLRGFAQACATAESMDAAGLARALTSGAEAAYRAVEEPVEGTILTVARHAAEAATPMAQDGSVEDTLRAAQEAARIAVAQTPDQLPLLRQAGVVDAGGEGLRVMLEGLQRELQGEQVEGSAQPVAAHVDLSTLHHSEHDFFGYCTELLVQGIDMKLDRIREELKALGTCVLVVGDEQLVKVHVHTLRPGTVLNVATDLGTLVKVKIDNMELQYQELVTQTPAKIERTVASPVAPPALVDETAPGTALVAVANGEGFAAIFESYGAVVVPGGPTMNPSVSQLAEGVRRANRAHVILLPNHRNVIMTAQQAASMVDGRSVSIFPTENLAQGVAATLTCNPEATAEQNFPLLQAAAERCRCIELTVAARDAVIDDVPIAAGFYMALLNGRLSATGGSLREVLATTLEQIGSGPFEVATIFVGVDGNASEAEELSALLTSKLGVPVETLSGGQAHYPYLVSVE
jgi:uncharacterized protein